MSAVILDGKVVREARVPELKARIAALARPPVLTIFQVGNRADSAAFIKAKAAFGARIGVESRHARLPESASQAELIARIREANADEAVRGIIVQLPLPASIDEEAVTEAIYPGKDVDALTSFNMKRWFEGREDALLPATTRGVRELCAQYGISFFGKRVAVVGRSMLVGKPLAAFALNEDATVSVCHSKTRDLAAETRLADILIVAAGEPKLIGPDHIQEGAVVIDVGIRRTDAGTLAGDVDFEAVKGRAGAITPVPGGVGPMTVLGLYENLIDLCSR